MSVVFMILIIIGLVTMFGVVIIKAVLYRLCRKLGLTPEEPLGGFADLRFHKFVREKCQEERYLPLRVWVKTQNILILTLCIDMLFNTIVILPLWLFVFTDSKP